MINGWFRPKLEAPLSPPQVAPLAPVPRTPPRLSTAPSSWHQAQPDPG